MTDAEWSTEIGRAAAAPPRVLQAHTYLGTRFNSYSRPAHVACTGNVECVVKKMETMTRRANANDQIVGRVGLAAAAPVATVELVDVPQELIAAQAEMSDFTAGVTHGTHFMGDISKTREGIAHIRVGGNRRRFAELAVLYGLAHVPYDHQFFYQRQTDFVYSIDHGHFFPNGPDWTISSLAHGPAAAPDATIAGGCQLTEAELRWARVVLDRVTDGVIANAIGSVPTSWGITNAERVALAAYLERRRGDLLAKLSA